MIMKMFLTLTIATLALVDVQGSDGALRILSSEEASSVLGSTTPGSPKVHASHKCLMSNDGAQVECNMANNITSCGGGVGADCTTCDGFSTEQVWTCVADNPNFNCTEGPAGDCGTKKTGGTCQYDDPNERWYCSPGSSGASSCSSVDKVCTGP